MSKLFLLVTIYTTLHFTSCAQQEKTGYMKKEAMISMRDGVKLFTAIYIPLNTSEKYPILLQRTPYSCAPYGENNYKKRLGPNSFFESENYIYVYQDVRGRYMSEGNFEEMAPAKDIKKSSKETDESSDTYDTIEWLIANISNNNGRAGIYGISYPGFYATASLPNAHPAIKAVSPQAPVTDEFEGDDAYHRGAFFVMDNFGFMNFFDHPRYAPQKKYPQIDSALSYDDAYEFFLKTGPLKNLDSLYFKGKSKIWNEYLLHATNDSYWQQRNIRTHLVNVKPATLVVGGWFDAEDLFGALNTYQAIEKQNKGNDNRLIMGPWTHGGWESKDWSRFAGYTFNANTSVAFQQMELNFFNHFLKDKGDFKNAEATVFVTGSNQWMSFDEWPPKEAIVQKWKLSESLQLLLNNTDAQAGSDKYVSDPSNPVPYINKKSGDRINEYMAADQSFASQRNDVLYYESKVLEKDITICGPITAKLFASLSTTDADFIVKVIDVLPDGTSTQQLVRAEVLRGKFRNNFTTPQPFEPGKPEQVQFILNDVAHTFLRGHKIMIQIQSSWFPLVDLNPQNFVNIPTATEKDFTKTTVTIWHNQQYPSEIQVMQLIQ